MEPWLRARSALKADTKFFKETGFEMISFYKDSFQVQVYSNAQLTSTATYSYANIISITITSSLYCLSLKLDRTYIIPDLKKSFVFGNQFDFLQALPYSTYLFLLFANLLCGKDRKKRRIYEGNSFKFRPNSIFSNLYPRRFSSMAAPIRNIVRQARAKT